MTVEDPPLIMVATGVAIAAPFLLSLRAARSGPVKTAVVVALSSAILTMGLIVAVGFAFVVSMGDIGPSNAM